MASLASTCLRATALLALAVLIAGCENISPESTLYGTVNVRVERRNGTPVPNAALTLYTGQRPMGYGTTDTTGRYSFQFVPEGLYGVYLAAHSGYVRKEDVLGGPPTDHVDALRLKANQALGASFTLLKLGKGTLTATITDSSGAPISNIPVQAYAQGYTNNRLSDAAGTVTFADLPTGNYGVVAMPSPKYRDEQDPLYIFRDGLLVEPDIPATTRFVLVPCGGSISVSLRDDAGGVVPKSKLFLYVSEGVVDSLVSSASGTATFSNLACRNYGVSIRAPMGYATDATKGSAFYDGLFVHKKSALTVTLTLRQCKATLRVRARDAVAMAIGGARVTLYSSDGIIGDLLTRDDGVATFDGITCNSDYGVFVTPPSGFTVTPGKGSSFYDGIRIAQGQTSERVFTLQRASANDR